MKSIIFSRPPPLDLPREADRVWIKISVNAVCQNIYVRLNFEQGRQQAKFL